MDMPEASCAALSMKRAMLLLTEDSCKLCVPNFKVRCVVLQTEAVRSVHRVDLLSGRQPVKPGGALPVFSCHSLVGSLALSLTWQGRSKRELDCSERAGSGRTHVPQTPRCDQISGTA